MLSSGKRSGHDTAAMREKASALLCLMVVFINGCTSMPKHRPEDYAAVRPHPAEPPAPQDGAIYSDGAGIFLYEDQRARRVGDLITIVLVEKTAAKKSASTSTSKSSEITAPAPTVFGRSPQFNAPGKDSLDLGLGMEIGSEATFDGGGDAALSNSLSGRITVTVTEVLPNGNLVVRGEKRVTINQGNEYIQIAGIVRPNDIQPDNTVRSTLVADAKITYTGDGVIGDSNSVGIFTRFFNKWWPF